MSSIELSAKLSSFEMSDTTSTADVVRISTLQKPGSQYAAAKVQPLGILGIHLGDGLAHQHPCAANCAANQSFQLYASGGSFLSVVLGDDKISGTCFGTQARVSGCNSVISAQLMP